MQKKADELCERVGEIAQQSRWVFAGKVFFVLSGFAFNALLARILGPTSLGRYQLGLTIIQIVTIFSVAGFDRGLIRFLPILQTKNSSEVEYVSVIILTGISFSAVAFTIMWILGFDEEDKRLIEVVRPR